MHNTMAHCGAMKNWVIIGMWLLIDVIRANPRVMVTFHNSTDAQRTWSIGQIKGEPIIQRQYGRRLILEYQTEVLDLNETSQDIMRVIGAEYIEIIELCEKFTASALSDTQMNSSCGTGWIMGPIACMFRANGAMGIWVIRMLS